MCIFTVLVLCFSFLLQVKADKEILKVSLDEGLFCPDELDVAFADEENRVYIRPLRDFGESCLSIVLNAKDDVLRGLNTLVIPEVRIVRPYKIRVIHSHYPGSRLAKYEKLDYVIARNGTIKFRLLPNALVDVVELCFDGKTSHRVIYDFSPYMYLKKEIQSIPLYNKTKMRVSGLNVLVQSSQRRTHFLLTFTQKISLYKAFYTEPIDISGNSIVAFKGKSPVPLEISFIYQTEHPSRQQGMRTFQVAPSYDLERFLFINLGSKEDEWKKTIIGVQISAPGVSRRLFPVTVELPLNLPMLLN